MRRRVAITFIFASLLMLIGLRLFALVSPTPSQAGSVPAPTTTIETQPNNIATSTNQIGVVGEPNAALGGFVWSDANMNGIRDAGEVGIGNVLVELHGVTAYGDWLIVSSTYTDAVGAYQFENLESERVYFVKVIRPKSHPLFTSQHQGSNDLIDSDVDPQTGYTTPAHLSNAEWNNGVGVGLVPSTACHPTLDFQTDALGNSLAAGPVPVEAWADWGIHFKSNAPLHLFNHSREDNAGGDYGGSGVQLAAPLEILFDTARPVYGLRMLDRDNLDASGTVTAYDTQNALISSVPILPYAEASSQLVILAAAGVQRLAITPDVVSNLTEIIFCETAPAPSTTLGGIVWQDADGDGNRNAGESGYPNTAVELRESDHLDRLLAITYTDEAGRYQFHNLQPRTYEVSVLAADAPTYDVDGTADGVASTLLVDSGIEVRSVHFGFRPNQLLSIDSGDAPDAYAQAHHTIDPQLHLGQLVDGDLTSQTSISAETDDTDGSNDDDGVTFFTLLGDVQQLQIEALNTVAEQPAYLSGWIDFNQDGDFEDPNEQIIDDLIVVGSAESQQLLLNYSPPADALPGTTIARFRLSTEEGLLPFGNAPNGEVEDYQIALAGDYGDAPFVYGTPSHLITNDLYLGVVNNADIGSLHHWAADVDASDDGVRFMGGPQLARGANAQLEITTAVGDGIANAYLSGWLDSNNNGQFEPSERLVDQPISDSQTLVVDYAISADAACGPTFARFRIGTQSLTATEPAGAGEVEDYRVTIACGPQSTVGGVVWHDVDQNGQHDTQERPFGNVTLTLYRDTGDRQFSILHDLPIATTRTNAIGHYRLKGLAVGTYFVVMDDHDAQLGGSMITDRMQTIIVAEDGRSDQTNFGLALDTWDALVSGRIWLDDGDAVANSAEIGIANTTVQAHDAAGSLIATAQTDRQGHYQFAQPLAPETKISVAPNSLPTYAQLLGDGAKTAQNTQPLDFPYALPAASRISGRVSRAVAAGQQPVPSVSIELIADDNGNRLWDDHEPILATTHTDALGQFTFGTLPAGNYLVYVSDIGGLLDQYVAQSVVQSVGLGESERSSSAEFNYSPTDPQAPNGIIGNFVWFETDFNGVHDPGESGLANVRILLLNQDNELLQETTTNATGHYHFTGLHAGVYQIVVSDTLGTLASYMPTLLRTVQREAVTVDLAAGEIMLGADFGYTIGQLSLGDRVWLDADGDGWQNEGVEMGLANVLLHLYVDQNHNRTLDDSDPRLDETWTDANGHYQFDHLRPGNYFIVIPPVALASPALSGGPTIPFSGENSLTAREDMPLDSNGVAHPTFGIVSNLIDLSGDEIADNGRLNNTVDFGFRQPR